jgi:hypothetical protein
MVTIVFRYAVDELYDVTVPQSSTVADETGVAFKYSGYDYFVPYSGILWMKADQ